jgi:hypothetical protein
VGTASLLLSFRLNPTPVRAVDLVPKLVPYPYKRAQSYSLHFPFFYIVSSHLLQVVSSSLLIASRGSILFLPKLFISHLRHEGLFYSRFSLARRKPGLCGRGSLQRRLAWWSGSTRSRTSWRPFGASEYVNPTFRVVLVEILTCEACNEDNVLRALQNP